MKDQPLNPYLVNERIFPLLPLKLYHDLIRSA